MTLSDQEKFRSWNERVVALLTQNPHPTSGKALSDTVSCQVPHDMWWCIFLGRHQTALVYDFYNQGMVQTDYTSGPYLVDPIYISYLRGDPAGVYVMRDLARKYPTMAARYFAFDKEYHSQIDEVGLTFDLNRNTRAVFSIIRDLRDREGGPFKRREVRQLAALSPVVETVIRNIWQEINSTGEATDSSRSDQHSSLIRFLEEFAPAQLTDRETEVGNFLIKGFNSKEIAKFLGISDGTVRNHTKKVYAKLQVRSQAELCGLFIEQALTKTIRKGPPGPKSIR